MPTVNLGPSATGYISAWTIGGGTRPTLVDGGLTPTHDDGASYIYDANGFIESYRMQQYLPSGIGRVNSIGANVRNYNDWADGFTTFSWGVRLGGTNLDVGSSTQGTGGGWVSRTASAIARPGGGTWQPEDLPTVEEYVTSGVGGGGNGSQVSTLWMPLDFEYNQGGFACLVGAIAGAALGLAEMARLAREVHLRTRVLIKPDEYVAAWRDIRGHRRPVTFLLGAR